MILTQSGGIIIGPIAKLLGAILSLIYDGLNSIGIVNIGVAIILFTFAIRLLLFPLMFKQNKASKITSYIQPEINKINKKYRGRKDQDSMLAQQAEVRQIQEKYGVNMTSGCLTSLLQLPIFLALYRVILNVPAYVGKIKSLYNPIADAIMKNEAASKAFQEFRDSDKMLSTVSLNMDKKDTVIDVLANFHEGTWEKFIDTIQGQNDVIAVINDNVGSINDAYQFIGGIDLTASPGLVLAPAIIIPILSMVFQYLSTHVTPMQPATDPQQEATMRTMKMMMNVFPIMSFIVCLNVPAGVGLYWAAGSLISFITSVGVNLYFKKCDMEKVVEKSKIKAAKKLAKRKAKGKKTFMERMQEAATQQNQNSQQSSGNSANRNVATQSLKSYTSATAARSDSNVKYKAGSLAAKANALQRYNDNGGK